MIKKLFVLTDFEGVTRHWEFRFHLSKIELSEKEILSDGQYRKNLEKISATSQASEVYPILKEFILDAVGQASADGTYFEKTPEIQRKFMQCGAYEMLVFEILSDAKAASDFMNGLMPADLVAEAQKIIEARTEAGTDSAAEHRAATASDFTEMQLLTMPQDQFDQLVGRDPQKMNREHLVLAMQRKTRGEK